MRSDKNSGGLSGPSSLETVYNTDPDTADKAVIRIAAEDDRDRLYELWQECFGDPEPFTEYYFNTYFKENRVLMLEDSGELKAMLHMNPYRISVRGHICGGCYIVGVATKKDYRHRKAMTRLMNEAFEAAIDDGLSFVYLMPAEEEIYRPLQFAYICMQQIEKDRDPKKRRVMPGDSRLTYRPADTGEDIEAVVSLANGILEKDYDIYTVRDAHYYERLIAENKADGGDLLMLYDRDEFVGYMSYASEDEIEGRELVCLPGFRRKVSEWFLDFASDRQAYALPLAEEGVLWGNYRCFRFYKPVIMGRIVNIRRWMSDMPVSEICFTLRVRIQDRWIAANDGCWIWECDGAANSFRRARPEEEGSCDINAGIDAFMQWLCGYRTIKDLGRSGEVAVVTDCMKVLKEIPVLNGIIINEII